MGVFAALASAERRSDDTVELNLPAPAAYQLSAAQLQRGELRITLSAADAPPLLARLQLPADLLVSEVGFVRQRCGAITWWKICVRLAASMSVPLQEADVSQKRS